MTFHGGVSAADARSARVLPIQGAFPPPCSPSLVLFGSSWVL